MLQTLGIDGLNKLVGVRCYMCLVSHCQIVCPYSDDIFPHGSGLMIYLQDDGSIYSKDQLKQHTHTHTHTHFEA